MGTVRRKTKALKKKKGALKKAETLNLPMEKSVPVESLGGYTALIYGRKKIGKTSLCSHFPKSLFVLFDPGGKALRLYQVSPKNWRQFVRYVDLVIKDDRFETVVIDTADIAYDDCLEHVCFQLGVDHPSDAGWGKGWNAVRTEFVRQIKRLTRSGKGVIFISHQRETEIEERSGKKYHMKTNTLSGQAKEALEGIVDIWANYDYDGKTRMLTIAGDDFTDAGNRCEENFHYTDGSPIREISMGNSSQESYENFVKAFYNKLEKPKGGGNALKKKKKKLLLKKKKLKKRS